MQGGEFLCKGDFLHKNSTLGKVEILLLKSNGVAQNLDSALA